MGVSCDKYNIIVKNNFDKFNIIIKYDHLKSLGKKVFKEKEKKENLTTKISENRMIKTSPPEKFESISDNINIKKEETTKTKGKDNNYRKKANEKLFIKDLCSKLRGSSPRKFKEKDKSSNSSKNLLDNSTSSNEIKKENSELNSNEEIKKSDLNNTKVEQNKEEKITKITKMDIVDFFSGEDKNSIIFKIIYDEVYLNTIFNLFERWGILECSKEPFFNEILSVIIFITYDQKKIEVIYNAFENDLLSLSKNKYTCYIINALMDKFHQNIINNSNELQNISIEKIENIFSKLKGNIKELSLHQSGTFIIQNLIDILYIINKKEEEREIYDVVLNNFDEFIKKQSGIYVMQKLIQINPRESDELIKKIIEYENFLDLIKDKNGNNRIIIDILNKTKNKYFDEILSKIKGFINELSKDKFASYIIQRLIEVADIKQTNAIYEEIKNDEKELAKHEQGNYVINSLNKKLKLVN